MTMKSSVASRLFTFHSNCSSVLYIYFISVPRETDILAENHDFFILPAFHAAIRGGVLVGILPYRLVRKN